jgi:coenzyme F420-reducing hydrogenase gamma subunit
MITKTYIKYCKYYLRGCPPSKEKCQQVFKAFKKRTNVCSACVVALRIQHKTKGEYEDELRRKDTEN